MMVTPQASTRRRDRGKWIALGAGIGMVLGAVFGNAGYGLVLGAAAGAAVGALRGRSARREDAASDS